jgi:hypothetical protein
VIDLPLASVPTHAPAGLPPAIFMVRSAGPGSKTTYKVACTVAVTSFAVHITAPDGRHVDKTQNVS